MSSIEKSSLAVLSFALLSLGITLGSDANQAFATENQPSAQAATVALTIANPKLSSTGKTGEIITMQSDVSVSATDIESYNLQISGSPTLDGPTTIPATADNVADLADNTWGYSWNHSNYYGISNKPVTIDNSGINNFAVNYTKPLTFAAKFGEQALAGHYTTKVNLSLITTPRTIVTMADISDMQQMTPLVCADSATGTTYNLKDTRNNLSYSVRKFQDHRCWMTQNLRITGKIEASQSDFDSPASLTLPNSISGFTSSDNLNLKAYITSTVGYYNWYTATAGAGTASFTSGSVSTSICPKGWTLPTGGSGGEYEQFYAAEGGPSTALIQQAPYNFAFNGLVGSGAIANPTIGYWWSGTAYSDSIAYTMYNDIASVGPAVAPFYVSRYGGIAVRCIARQ